MTGWLLDTNVISELYKPRPEPKVVKFIAAQDLADMHISVMTIAELRKGIELKDDPVKRSALHLWLEHTIRSQFEGRVLAMCENVLLRWLLLDWRACRCNETLPAPDILIGATAVQYGLTVVSRDVTPYLRAGIAVCDPWREGAAT